MLLNRYLKVTLLVLFLFTTFQVGKVISQDLGPTKPSKTDKCPVCGMFVYKYPDWIAQAVFKDGTRVYFDGAKDLFKYYHHLEKYEPHRTLADIEQIFVTEWYDMMFLDASTAVFVTGSDVYGPMGKELIPFANTSDAETFKHDHKGQHILTFTDVTPSILRELDQ